MNYMSKIAAIGDKDSVMAFMTLGIEVFPVTDDQEAGKAILHAARDGFEVIFITEQAAQNNTEIIGRYANDAYPAIIPIPSNQGSLGIGMHMLRTNVEKALGADILFGKEG